MTRILKCAREGDQNRTGLSIPDSRLRDEGAAGIIGLIITSPLWLHHSFLLSGLLSFDI